MFRGADVALLLVDLASDEGLDQYQELLDRLNETKTRLGTESYLDQEDIGLSYTRTFLVPNKIDVDGAAERWQMMQELYEPPFEAYPISAVKGEGIEPLRNAIYQALDVVRVYTKVPTRKEPDYDRPYTIRRGGTLADVAAQIHKDLARDLKFARVWGSQVHDGTTVKGDYVLQDRDVVELHT